MLLTDKANNHGALLHSLLCVLNLEYAALRRANAVLTEVQRSPMKGRLTM